VRKTFHPSLQRRGTRTGVRPRLAAVLLGAALLPAVGGGCDGRLADAGSAVRPVPPLTVAPEEPTLASILGEKARMTALKQQAGALGTLESEGVGRLSCASLDVEVQIEGRLARTEVTQVFKNHQARQLEGTYRFMLPAGASIARLAMDVNGTMMEGELVEKEKARAIYESIVTRRKDPALLEWDGGNRFTTRIFPIPARGTKTVVLAYEQLLPQDHAEVRYRYQLPKLVGEKDPERIGRFTFRLAARQATQVRVAGYDATTDGKSATLSATDFIPAGPVEVNLLAAAGVSSALVAHQTVGKPGDERPHHVFGVDWAPAVDAATSRDRDLVIAVDTSASVGDVELDRAVKAAMVLARRHSGDKRVMAVYGDLKAHACQLSPWQGGTEAEVGVARCLNRRMARGASDLRWLIGAAMQAAASMDGADIVLFADGAPSVGELDVDLIIAEARARAARADARLHTLAIGHTPDEELMRQLARATGGHAARLLPSSDPAIGIEDLLRRRRLALIEDVRVEVVSGEVQDLIAPPSYVARGEPALAMGRLASEGATLRFTGTYAGQPLRHEVQITKKQAKQAPIMGRFWARAKIGQQMTARAPRAEVVATSVDWGVMSPHTSFLVLENERMYAQNAIDRRKKAERTAQTAKKKPTAFRKTKDRLQDVLQGALTKGAGDAKIASRGGEGGEIADVFGGPADAPARAPQAMAEPQALERPTAEEPKAEKKKRKRSAKARVAPRARTPESYPGLLGLIGTDGASSDAGLSTRGAGAGGGRGLGFAAPIASLDGEGRGGRARDRVVEVRLGDVAGVDRRDVERVLKMRRVSMLACDRNLGDRGGSTTLEVGLTSTGRVSSAEERSGFGADVFRACVKRVLARIRFPRPASGFGSFLVSVQLREPDQIVIDGKAVSLSRAQARQRKLSADGLGTLLDALAARGDEKAAAKVRKTLVKKVAQATAREQFGVLVSPALIAVFPDESIDVLVALVAAGEANASDILMFERVMNLKRSVRLADAAKTAALAPREAKVVVDVLTPDVRGERSRELVRAWAAASSWTATQELAAVNTSVADRWRHERAFILATQLVADSDPVDDAVLQALTDNAARVTKQAAAGATIAEACRDARLAGDRCLRFIDAEGVSDADRLLFLLLARRADFEKRSYIKKMVALLDKAGARGDAQRVLSELVELSPRDVDRRHRYFFDLRSRGDNVEACRQAATVVQLDPAQRDLFREMMDLSRDDVEARPAVQQCVTDGVSMLPVRRDISVVLTWDDPTADVDLHITEPGGEKVNFSHRESQAGGLLYYDVRNGLGPEIYTLSEVPKGKLKLGIVYYAGTAKEVPVTMTVMRNAGAPDETREVFTLVLRGANPDVLKPVTTLSY
jgi:hypothetical protein